MSSTSSTSSDKVETGDETESHVSTEGGQWICHPVIRPVTTEQCETESHVSTEGGQWICHPVIRPVTTEQCETLPIAPLQIQGIHIKTFNILFKL